MFFYKNKRKSELHNNVLLYFMDFLDNKDWVKTTYANKQLFYCKNMDQKYINSYIQKKWYVLEDNKQKIKSYPVNVYYVFHYALLFVHVPLYFYQNASCFFFNVYPHSMIAKLARFGRRQLFTIIMYSIITMSTIGYLEKQLPNYNYFGDELSRTRIECLQHFIKFTNQKFEIMNKIHNKKKWFNRKIIFINILFFLLLIRRILYNFRKFLIK